MIYNYKEALEAARAKVHAFETWGDYEGSWLTKVTLPSGKTGWIRGHYGSCSGCDALSGVDLPREPNADETQRAFKKRQKKLAEEFCADYFARLESDRIVLKLARKILRAWHSGPDEKNCMKAAIAEAEYIIATEDEYRAKAKEVKP